MIDTLDIEDHRALRTYLIEAGRIPAEDRPFMHTLGGGVSNRTVLVEGAAGSWVLKQALPKLRVAVEWTSNPERVHREAAGLRWLERLAPPGSITPLVFEDYAHHLLAIQAVPQPHDNWKTVLLQGSVDARYVEQFGVLLGTVHRRASESRPEIAAEFDDRSYFESLRVEPYYLYTADSVPSAAPFLRRLVDETRSLRLTLVHGDYSPKNVLIREGRVVLLDHEVIHFGDPAFDLGFSLTHLLSKAHHLPERRGVFAAAAVDYWRSYAEALGTVPWRDSLEARSVRHTLGCLLARVDGRSPLEYLDEMERVRQRRVVLGLMARSPATVPALVEQFVAGLEIHRED